MQCAAVKMWDASINEPPQKWRPRLNSATIKGQEFLNAVVPPTMRLCSSRLNVFFGPLPQLRVPSSVATTGSTLGFDVVDVVGVDVVDVVLSGTHHGLVVLGLLVEVVTLVGDFVVNWSGTHHGLVVPGREVVVVGSGTHHGLVVLGRVVVVVGAIKGPVPTVGNDGAPNGK